MDDFNDLQRLLRLKRHETPPPEFFEDFMIDFHQRQRAELLKRPIWRLALDRLEGAFPVFPAVRYAYAGSCAVALLAAGLTSARILNAPVGSALADAQPSVARPHFAPPANSGRLASAPRRIDFNTSRPSFALAELDFDNPRTAPLPASSRPRYVLDSVPVSYEQPFSF